MTVGEVARDRAITASPDATFESIVESMAEHDVGCIVVEQHGEPIGIVTDRKIAVHLRDTPDLPNHAVTEYMTTDLVTVHESDGVKGTIETLSEAGIRRVPVVDDGDELVGIVSVDDLAVLLADEVDDLSQVVAKQSPRF